MNWGDVEPQIWVCMSLTLRAWHICSCGTVHITCAPLLHHGSKRRSSHDASSKVAPGYCASCVAPSRTCMHCRIDSSNLVAPAPANVCFTTHSRAAAEEEGEEENDYDLTDKFLADGEDEGKGGSGGEEDEEDGEGGEEGAKKRRKKRRREALQLEEEDYDLLEENQVTVSRPGFPHEHHMDFSLRPCLSGWPALQPRRCSGCRWATDSQHPP